MLHENMMNCMTVIVGKAVSESGRVLVAHNEDDPGHAITRHVLVPAAKHPAGELIPAEKGLARIPQLVSSGLLGVSDNAIVVLLIIMVVMLLAGTVMDPTPAILIFTPIFLPVVTALGVDPIHFGALMVFNMCLGNVSPPIGNNLFVAARVANVRIEALIGKLWPTFWALCIGLLVVTFIPAISTWLPTTLGLMG